MRQGSQPFIWQVASGGLAFWWAHQRRPVTQAERHSGIARHSGIVVWSVQQPNTVTYFTSASPSMALHKLGNFSPNVFRSVKYVYEKLNLKWDIYIYMYMWMCLQYVRKYDFFLNGTFRKIYAGQLNMTEKFNLKWVHRCTCNVLKNVMVC